jgi:hypothetical protein
LTAGFWPEYGLLTDIVVRQETINILYLAGKRVFSSLS